MELVDAARAGVMGELSVTSNREGAQVRVDGRAQGPVPLRISLPVGRHDVEVSFDGQRRSEHTVVQMRTPAAIHIDLPEVAPVAVPKTPAQTQSPAPDLRTGAAAAAQPPPPFVPARASKGGSIAMLAAGVVLLGGGGFGAWHANSVKQDFDRQQSPSVTPTVTRATAQRAQWMFPVSLGGAAVGVGLVALGAVGLLSGGEDTGSGGGFMVSVDTDGAAVGYGGAF